MVLESSELGQYSCIELLKEMEALESDVDEDDPTMSRG
jgi:hypothetical protein